MEHVIRDVFNFDLCKRSIENSLEEATRLAQPVYSTIMELIKQGHWVGADETGKRVEGERWWEWVWQNEIGSYYAIDKSRGYQVVAKHFGEDYLGSFVHDCWSAHNNTVAGSGHQQCLPHIQRELNFLIQAYNSSWADRLNTLLTSAQKLRPKIWAEDMNPLTRASVILDYRLKLKQFIIVDSPHHDVRKLQKRIRKHEESILHFMLSPDIPHHNNSSEQAIRMAKVKQKISGGFRSHRGAERHSILLSVIETAKKQRLDILTSIRSLLNNTLVFQGA